MQNCFNNPFTIVVIIVILNQYGLLNTKCARGRDAMTLVLFYLLWIYFYNRSCGYVCCSR